MNQEQPLEEEEELEEGQEELEEISMGMGTGHDPNVPPEIKRDNEKFMKNRKKEKDNKQEK